MLFCTPCKVCKKARVKMCNLFARDSGQNTHDMVCKNTHLFEKHALRCVNLATSGKRKKTHLKACFFTHLYLANTHLKVCKNTHLFRKIHNLVPRLFLRGRKDPGRSWSRGSQILGAKLKLYLGRGGRGVRLLRLGNFIIIITIFQ